MPPLNDKVAADGCVHIKIRRAICRLQQSGKLANNQLKENLAKHGHFPSKHAPGLFFHKTRPISFSLVADDFGVCHQRQEDAEHLVASLKKHHPIKTDWTGSCHVGIDLHWDHNNRTLKTSMKNYVKRALLQFQHPTPTKPQHSPSPFTPPNYGSKIQMATVDNTKPMTPAQKQQLQQITGKFLYLARSVDDTTMHALNDLATKVNTGTQTTVNALKHFLDYYATHSHPKKVYRASDMILNIHSDAAYLVASEARSRAGGFHYLSNAKGTKLNGSVAVIAKIIKNVCSSAAEAEIAALFMNATHAVPLINTLTELGHKQPATPIWTDNSTAYGILNDKVNQNRSKSIDMRYYWLRDRIRQKQFSLKWAPGATNLADYYTKHHPAKHHKKVRPIYMAESNSPTEMQGCVDLLALHTLAAHRAHAPILKPFSWPCGLQPAKPIPTGNPTSHTTWFPTSHHHTRH